MSVRRVVGAALLLLLALAAVPMACGLSALELLRRKPPATAVGTPPPPVGARAGYIGPAGGRRRVWIVAIDGLSSQDWQKHWDGRPFATLRGIYEQGVGTLDARVGGGPERCGPEARFDTSSGWTNVLTGVDCVQHGVENAGQRARFYETHGEHPTLFWTARQLLGLRTGIAGGPGLLDEEQPRTPGVVPNPLEIEGRPDAGGGDWTNLDFRRATRGFDDRAEQYTLEALFAWDLDVMLTHFDGLDHIGHMHGWGTRAWAQRLEQTDLRVGRILAAIRGETTAAGADGARLARRRDDFAQEDWLVVIVSDHGGHATPGCRGLRCCVPGYGRCGTHDQRAGSDDRVPLLMMSLGGRATPLRPLQSPLTQMDVQPTVLAWLGWPAAEGPDISAGVQGAPP